MIDDALSHMDYVLVIVIAIILYRLLGRPLAYKV